MNKFINFCKRNMPEILCDILVGCTLHWMIAKTKKEVSK